MGEPEGNQDAAHHRSEDLSPLISVIITTHYRNELLAEAIESVLAQEYDPVELIVVDDSGEGHATPVLERYDDAVIGITRETNGGDMVARTTGFNASTGEFIHFLDDDDRFLAGKLSKSAAVLMNDSDVGVAFTGVRYSDQDVEWTSAPSSDLSENMLEYALRFESSPCYTGSMLIRRHLLADVLPLPQLPAANDSNLKIELAQRTKFDYVDEYLVHNRRGESEIWVGVNKFDGMNGVIELHEELYDDYPELKRDVLTKINYEEGSLRLNNRLWSPKAPRCFAKAAYYSTENRLTYSGAAIASLFGRPGLEGAGNLKNLIANR